MFKNLETGILDRTRLISNLLMLVLLVGNIFFSIQYISYMKSEAVQKEDNMAQKILISRFLKSFVDFVINPQGKMTFEDRIKLENDVRQIHDPELIALWDKFTNSKDVTTAQTNAVKILSMLANKML